MLRSNFDECIFFYSGSLSLTRRKRKEGHAEGGGVEYLLFSIQSFLPSLLRRPPSNLGSLTLSSSFIQLPTTITNSEYRYISRS